jgi:hypothetical protein
VLNDEKTKRFQDFRARAGIDELEKADEAQYLRAAQQKNQEQERKARLE